MMSKRNLRCSFCGKDENKVAKLVAGPSVYICDVCVAIATQIMKDSSPDATPPPGVKSSMWRRLVSRVRAFHGDAQVSAVGFEVPKRVSAAT
jgi:ATP-dependent protease Clp ATPase subunit